jgi:hypothetical protein
VLWRKIGIGAGGTLGTRCPSWRCSLQVALHAWVVPERRDGASNYVVAALGPAIRNQVLGIIRGHLDDAIWLDVQVPLGKGLHSPAPVPGGGPEANPQAFSVVPTALRVPIALSLHPDELEISLARERALEPIQKMSDASGGSLVAGTPSPCRTEFLVCRQTLLTSTRKGCCSILAINKTSQCFCSAISKV